MITLPHNHHLKCRHDFGDAMEKFSIQSAGKAFNYGFFNDSIGREEVILSVYVFLWIICKQLHRYIGKEPSGLKFNEIALDSEGRCIVLWYT